MEVEQPKNGEERQRKIWLVVFSSLLVLIIGLVIAIVVVANMRAGNNTNCPNDDGLTEEERKAEQEKAELEEYKEIHETIDKIIEATRNLEESDLVKAYQYYISEASTTAVKNMLRRDLLMIEMAYDTEKTRGDELINVAIEIDDEEKTSGSAALVMSLADNYDKAELSTKYEIIMNERFAAEGYKSDEGAKG